MNGILPIIFTLLVFVIFGIVFGALIAFGSWVFAKKSGKA
jgi:hypothetical protein